MCYVYPVVVVVGGGGGGVVVVVVAVGVVVVLNISMTGEDRGTGIEGIARIILLYDMVS